MCRSKAQGGNRCVSHLTKTAETQQAKVARWNEALIERRAEYDKYPNYRTKRKMKFAENALQEAQQQLKATSSELEEAKSRPRSRVNRFTGLDNFLTQTMKPEEWNKLTLEAAEQGITRSALIRDRLHALPVIAPAVGHNIKQEENETTTWGRQPTSQASHDVVYSREHRGVRLTEADSERLTQEAAVFNIIPSDYARALVTGMDPRTLGHHVGQNTTEETVEWLSKKEREAGVTGKTVQDYYHQEIQAVRARFAA